MTLMIEGREYTLSPRRTVDVFALYDFITEANREGDEDGKKRRYFPAQIVSDSLRATHLDLGRIRGFRYRQFTGKRGVSRLIAALPPSAIRAAAEAVDEMEGSKKKAQESPAASPSDAVSPGA